MPLDDIERILDICLYRIRMPDHATQLVKAGGAGLPWGAQCENFDEVHSEMIDMETEADFDFNRMGRIYDMILDAKLFRLIEEPKRARWSYWVILYVIWSIHLAGKDDAFALDTVQKMQGYLVQLERKEELQVIQSVVAREVGNTYIAPFRRAHTAFGGTRSTSLLRYRFVKD